MLGKQGDCRVLRGIGELLVGLVDDDDRIGGRTDLVYDRHRDGGAGRVVRRGQQDDVRFDLLDGAHDLVGGQTVGDIAGTSDVLGVSVAGVLGIHRVGRREGQESTARATEGLQNVGHDLVGPIGRPDLTAADPESDVPGKVLAQPVASRSG